MFKKITFAISAILFSNLINAQETIPFRITKYNNIIVKTLVNDKDSLNLMFQIAMEDASISPERSRPAKSIVFKDEISENNTVKIGKLEFKNVKFYDNELTGREADGKIGTGIFKGKTYQIDYDNNQFVIYEKLPDITGYREVSYISNKEGQIFLSCDNIMENENYEANFLLQSGYSGGLLYSNTFADGKDLDTKLKITGEKTLKNSAGKSVTTKQGILPSLIVTDVTMKDVSAGFFTGDIKNQKTNYFGADLIRRFNWIFDAETERIYITPSKYFNEPYFKVN
jgi:hypothetical protein